MVDDDDLAIAAIIAGEADAAGRGGDDLSAGTCGDRDAARPHAAFVDLAEPPDDASDDRQAIGAARQLGVRRGRRRGGGGDAAFGIARPRDRPRELSELRAHRAVGLERIHQFDDVARLLAEPQCPVSLELRAAHQFARAQPALVFEPGERVAAVRELRLARRQRLERDRLLPPRRVERGQFAAHARGAARDYRHRGVDHRARMDHVGQRSRLREHADRRLAAQLLQRRGEFEQGLLLLGEPRALRR